MSRIMPPCDHDECSPIECTRPKLQDLWPQRLIDLKEQSEQNSLAAKQAYINGLESEFISALIEIEKYKENL